MLQETPSGHYAQRTQWNIRDSDATAVFTIRPCPTGGTRLTLELTRRLGKPALLLTRGVAAVATSSSVDGNSVTSIATAAAKLRAFLDEHQVRTLNIAGPRASQESEIAEFVGDVLQRALIG